MVFIIVYFFAYLVASICVKDDMKVMKLIMALTVVNNVLILGTLCLYTYSIILLKKAIAQCSSFKFTKAMYVITWLYSLTLLVQVLFLMMEEFYSYSVIIDIIMHKILFAAQAITIYWLLEHTGSGLKLMSHRLNDGSM